MYSHEAVTLSRECGAIQIPDGDPVVLPAGTEVVITQQLGGSYTVMDARGGMFRIDQNNADALGKEVPRGESEAPESGGSLEDRVWGQLRKCYDPEIPVNVVDLGLIYNCDLAEVEGGGHRVNVKMTLTAPGCGMGPVLAHDVKSRLEKLPGVEEAVVEVVFDPPWNQNMMTEAARLQLGFF